MKRRLLITAMIGIAVLGAIFAAIPFLGSLQPNDRGRASLVSVSISELGVGHFKVLERPNRRIYIIRRTQDEFLALWVPTDGEAVLMPDGKWWRPARACAEFGPGIEQGQPLLGAKFTCREPGLDAWQADRWQWDASGRYVGPSNAPFDDMPTVRFERTGSHLLLRAN